MDNIPLHKSTEELNQQTLERQKLIRNIVENVRIYMTQLYA